MSMRVWRWSSSARPSPGRRATSSWAEEVGAAISEHTLSGAEGQIAKQPGMTVNHATGTSTSARIAANGMGMKTGGTIVAKQRASPRPKISIESAPALAAATRQASAPCNSAFR